MNNFENLVTACVSAQRLAEEFEPTFYRNVQSDLNHLDNTQLLQHYSNHGRSEGRIASPAATRIGFLAQISDDIDLLEIGPAVRPSLTGPRVAYFDTSDREGLIARAIREKYDASRCPDIKYVSPNGDLSVIQDTFDAVFSSHCIEHQPDLIYHLQCVERLLRPNGKYFLIVPDKRYCFDALLAESTLEEILLAHSERRTVHTWEHVLEHYVDTTHNFAPQHWCGDHDDPRIDQKEFRAQVALQTYQAAAGGYVDVHAWKFTPTNFRTIMTELSGKKMNLRVERVYETVRNSHEFCCVLSKFSEPRIDEIDKRSKSVFRSVIKSLLPTLRLDLIAVGGTQTAIVPPALQKHGVHPR